MDRLIMDPFFKISFFNEITCNEEYDYIKSKKK